MLYFMSEGFNVQKQQLILLTLQKQWPTPQAPDNWYTQQHYQQIQNEDQNRQQHLGYWQQPISSQNYNQQYEQNQIQGQYQPE